MLVHIQLYIRMMINLHKNLHAKHYDVLDLNYPTFDQNASLILMLILCIREGGPLLKKSSDLAG